MKIEKKDKYVAPLTVVTRSEVEESFCASADVTNVNGSAAAIKSHEESDFSYDNTFTNEGWDK